MKRLLLILAIGFICFLAQAQTSLNTVWMNGFGGPIGNDQIHQSCVDASGNIYIIGQTQNTLDIDPGPPVVTVAVNSTQAYFSKFSPNGTMLWSRHFDGESVAYSEGNAIAVDASGDVYVAGIFASGIIDFNLTSPGTNTIASNMDAKDMFIAKYSSSGAFVSVRAIGNSSANVTPIQMKFDAAGDLIISGHLYQELTNLVDFNPAGPAYTVATNGNTDGFVAKFNTAGICQFAVTFGGTLNDYCYGMDVDATNNVYISGIFKSVANFAPLPSTYTIAAVGTEGMCVAKYSSTGTLAWVHGIGGALAEGGLRLKIDNNNDIIALGYMTSASLDADPSPTITLNLTKEGTGPTDAIVTKFDAAGNLIWAKNTGGTGEMWPYNVTTDAQNNIYLVGAFEGINDFDLTASVNTQTAITLSGQDAYLAKYTSTGGYIYAHTFGGGASGYNMGYEVHIASNNDVLFGGIFIDGSVDFDPSATATNTLTHYGGQDVFYCRYSQCISPDVPVLAATSVSVCANGVATLSIASGNLNSATTWVWTAMSCGSSTIGTGPTVTVSPVFLTSYFVRGEGGCPTPTGSCASASVTVIASKDITGSVTTSLSAPVTGSVMIYRYEGALTMWDYVGFQNIDASGNYTFNAVNSNNYIIKCVPVSNTLQVTYSPDAISWKGATVFAHSCLNTATMNISVKPIIDIGTGPGVLSGKITEGVGYASRGTSIFAPGNPIKGMIIKGGRNPGGDIVNQVVTDAAGGFTINGLPENTAGQNYFLYVDIPGLDTNGTYRRAIITGSTSYTNLDFVADSSYIHPILNFVGVQEVSMDDKIISVYPNPASSKITVAIDKGNVNALSVVIVDVFGKVIRTHTFESNEEKVSETMDVSDLSKGIYFIRIGMGNTTRQVKLIISE